MLLGVGDHTWGTSAPGEAITTKTASRCLGILQGPSARRQSPQRLFFDDRAYVSFVLYSQPPNVSDENAEGAPK